MRMNIKVSLFLVAVLVFPGCVPEQVAPDPDQCQLAEVSWSDGTEAFAEATESW